MIKKCLLVMGMALALGGCNNPPDGTEYIRQAHFNSEEREVYNAYFDQRFASFKYTQFLESVFHARTKANNVPSGFFCDSLDLLKIADYRAKNHNAKGNGSNGSDTKTLSAMYSDIYGKTPHERCGKPEPFQTPKPIVAAPVVVPMAGKGNVLSPEMYDKLIEAAKTCGRSRQHLISLTNEKEYLTQVDYDEVMKSVMSCKKFELESQLQQPNK